MNSAKKAAATRAANRESMKHFREVYLPTNRRMDVLLNSLLPAVNTLKLRWNPLPGLMPRRLKHDVQCGELIKFADGGRTLIVLPEGYKRPQSFLPGCWELSREY